MRELSLWSQITLYMLLATMGFYGVAIFAWQLNVIRGKPMRNADGTHDDWHEQKIFYGMAFADLILACPVVLGGIVLVFIAPVWGHALLALAGFWLVWANIMTTSTSLKFEQPRLNWSWFIAFPAGAIVGLAYLLWLAFHVSALYQR